MITSGEIQQLANKAHVRDLQIEKDYIITWILKGISENAYLAEQLVFKGGTALKKNWFSDYRYSEDLDFTFPSSDWNTNRIEQEFGNVFEWIYEQSRIAVKLRVENITEAQYQCYHVYKGPLGGLKGVKCDISKDELIYFPIEKRAILDDYTDAEDILKIKSYTLEEALAEKLRSMMQRTIPRDIYDIWYLTEVYGLDIQDVAFGYSDKVRYKGLEPQQILLVLDKKEAKFRDAWVKSLSHQIGSLPEFDEVWRALRRQVKYLLEVLNT